MNPLLTTIVVAVLGILIGIAAGYYLHRYQTDKALRDQQEKTTTILKGANEQARLIEAQARENAQKLVQAVEQDIKERRAENSREAEDSTNAGPSLRAAPINWNNVTRP